LSDSVCHFISFTVSRASLAYGYEDVALRARFQSSMSSQRLICRKSDKSNTFQSSSLCTILLVN
ncbi:MAG: hypothetical protein LBN74_05255, partial [Prevotella sp.]|nr:hypothetical protein [Prevotella sp.]